MTMNNFVVNTATVVGVLCALGGCDTYMEARYGEFKDVGLDLVEAARAGDSSRVVELTIDDAARERINALQSRDRTVLEAMSESLEMALHAPDIRSDTADVAFIYSVEDSSARVIMRFANMHGRWRVVKISFPPR